MKKVLLFVIINCLCVGFASSQTRSRVFDNFEAGAFQLDIPAVKPVALQTASKTPPANKKTIKKTAQTMSVGDGLSVRNVAASNVYSSGRLVMSSGTSLGAFTTGDAVIDSYIVDSSRRYEIDPLLIYAQMHQESGFKLKATSYKGARGLMQLMPGTAMRFGVKNIYDPKQNIEAGIKYMRWLIDKFGGDVVLALAGYNAGEGAVMKYGWQIPPYNETREYVRRISARYNAIKNPNLLAKTAKKVSEKEVAKLEQKEAAPLTAFEQSPLTVRLPDGRMRLVNQ